ncbi:HAMP domain-containing histidine kinase [Candidatus Saccharibacteria bacterium]|nr:HAMP domain-containing histidine kinase [Candidatus Saccharibacteria bacterium]
MFKKLRNRIIIITMSVTTAVLILAGVFITLFSSNMRPEPKPRIEVNYSMPSTGNYNDEELKLYIKTDREEGRARLLITLLAVGAIVEVAVFIITYFASQKIVEPVKDSYEKQKMFIANASHELKTPLAIIQANMEALDVNKDNEKWKHNIENEVTHANKLVLDLLQLARMDAGSTSKKVLEKVNLRTEIEKRIKMFEAKFNGKINFKYSGEEGVLNLPKQDVLQVLDILLDNATKYGDKKIKVILDKNRITISNDGATVSQNDLEKIFDRFYQTDKTKDGSGLGLAIAKTLCEQNGWDIRCDSTKNLTSFILTLK